MKKLIATIALSVTLAGCGTSLTYDNGDVNWKAVAITSGTFLVGVLLCNEFCEVGHDVRVEGGELEVDVNTSWSEEDANRFKDSVDYLKTLSPPDLTIPEVALPQQ